MFAATLFATGSANAVTLAYFDFAGNSYVSSDADPYTTAGPLTVGPGLLGGTTFDGTYGAGAPSFSIADSITSDSIGSAVAGADYLSFTLTPNAGFSFGLVHMEIETKRLYTGSDTEGAKVPKSHIELRTSLDGFAAGVGEVVGDDPDFVWVKTFSFETGNPLYVGITVPVEFRLYFWDENDSGAPYSTLIDNVNLMGPVSASAVPLPPAAWLLGTALLGFARFSRRRQQAQSL